MSDGEPTDRVIAAAMRAQHDWHDARLARRDERAVASFAPFLVAAWLGRGARVLDDPAATWDIDWDTGDRLVQVHVVCCAPGGSEQPAVWELADHVVDGGDAAVLVHPDQQTVGVGWRYFVVAADALDGRERVTARQLAVLGAAPVDGAGLAEQIRQVLAS